MLKKLAIAAILLLLVVSAVQTQRACKFSDDARDAKIKYDTLRALTNAQEKARLQHVADLEATILELQSDNKSLGETVKVKDKTITGLVKKAGDLVVIGETLHDKDAIIGNLRQQVETWKAAFNLSEENGKAKDEIIFNLTTQYNTQLKISLDYKKLYEDQKALNAVALERINILEKKPVSLLDLGTPQKGLVILLLVLAGYGLLK